MCKIFLLMGILAALVVTGCETVNTPNGPRSVLRSESLAVVNTLVSTGAGTATGAVMGDKSNSMAVGAVSGATGSISQQIVAAFLPTRANAMKPRQQYQQPTQYQPRYQQAPRQQYRQAPQSFQYQQDPFQAQREDQQFLSTQQFTGGAR